MSIDTALMARVAGYAATVSFFVLMLGALVPGQPAGAGKLARAEVSWRNASGDIRRYGSEPVDARICGRLADEVRQAGKGVEIACRLD